MAKRGWEEKEKIEVPLYRVPAPESGDQSETEEEVLNETPVAAPAAVSEEAPAAVEPETPAEGEEPAAEPPEETPAEPAAQPEEPQNAAAPAPVQVNVTPVRAEKRRSPLMPLISILICAALLAVTLALSLDIATKLQTLAALNEELAVLEYRVALLEDSDGTVSDRETMPPPAEDAVVAHGDALGMVSQTLRDYYGLRGSEIVGVMDYQCPFDDYMMDAILIRVQVNEYTTQAAANCGGYILIDRIDGTVLDYSDIVMPEDTVPQSYEHARDLLFWAFSCRPPEVAWNDSVWSEMESRRTWTQEEVDTVRAVLER